MWSAQSLWKGAQDGAIVGLFVNKSTFTLPTAMRVYYEGILESKVGFMAIRSNIAAFLATFSAISIVGIATQLHYLNTNPGLFVLPVATNAVSLIYELSR
ncbi:MAG: hypothetical protein HGA85_03415, partial [Nanoarchaeota archaeon]|nr:hypothetical protein [Nanoarchaeota archaeon]